MSNYSNYEMLVGDADFLVQADSFAYFRLLEDLDKDGVDFTQLPGWTQVIDQVLGYPINLCFSPVGIAGKVVIFYDCVSVLCQTEVVESWLKANFKKTWDNTRWAHCDANNFHCCRIALSVQASP